MALPLKYGTNFNWAKLRVESLEDRSVPTAMPPGAYFDAAPVEWQGAERLAVPGRWVVQADGYGGTAGDQAEAFEAAVAGLGLGVHVESQLGLDGLFRLAGPTDLSADALGASLAGLGGVRYTEPDFVDANARVTPNDPEFARLWGLNNTGTNPGVGAGVADADVDAPEAWDLTGPSRGSTQIVTAVVDSGVDYTHPDLYLNIWLNQTEIPAAIRPSLTDTDGDALITFWDLNAPANAGRVTDNNFNGRIDAGDVLRPTAAGGWMDAVDGNAAAAANGFTDDLIGWDFFSNENNPDDEVVGVWHGTHVAGTIGAIGNNGVGVAGVNWKTQIMVVRGLGPSNSGPYTALFGGLNYAVANGAKVSNHSWGGSAPSAALEASVVNARDKGHLMVVAAGNGGADGVGDNLDAAGAEPAYPAIYPYDNVVTVANLTNLDQPNSNSNFGATSVDLGAPGTNIFSTFHSVRAGSYGYLSGTSMATPHVTGAAALAWAANPGGTYTQIRNTLLQTVDPVNALRLTGPKPVATGGRLNVARAVQAVGFRVLNTTPAVGSVVATPPTSFAVHFSQPYAPGSVQPADLRVNGVPASGVEFTDDDTATFTFAASPVSAEGEQTIAVAVGAVTAANGSAINPFTGTFRYDATPLAVTGTNPAPNAVVAAPFAFLELTFNETVSAASLQPADLVVSRGTVTGVEVVPGTNNRTVRFALSGLTTSGPVSATLPAGAVADAFGNPGPAAAFSAQFGVNTVGVVFPVPLTALPPLGGAVYFGSAAGSIVGPGELDAFTLSVDAGQRITAVVTPGGGAGEFAQGAASPLRPTVTLRDPAGTVVATAAAPTAGGRAVLQLGRADALGTYTVTVGTAGGADSYSLVVYLNAAAEDETFSTTPNGSRGTAQSLTPAFVSLNPEGSADRAAVRGRAGTPVGADNDFYAIDLAAGQRLDLGVGVAGLTPGAAFAATRTDYAPATVATYAMGVGYADLNADGKLDMIGVINVLGSNAGQVGVRLGNGDGTFGGVVLYPTGGLFTRFVDFGDVNADGKLDVVASNDSSGTVSLFLGRGDGTLNPAVVKAVDPSALGLTVRDLNGDGRADVVTAHFGGRISVLLANAAGGFGTPAFFSTGGSGAFGTAVGDVNGDGKLDVATANFSSANMSVLLGNGAGGFTFAGVFSMANNPWAVALADFNGDGKLDAVTGNQGSGNVAVRLGNGNGTFANPTFFATGGNGPRTVSLGDVNGDGRLDIAVPNIGSATVGILPGDGKGGFGSAQVFATVANPNAAVLADVNGDGLADVSSADAGPGNGGSISVRLNTTQTAALELQDAAGNVLARGTVGAANLATALAYTPAAAGTYYARVTGTGNLAYTLVAARNAVFEREANDTAAAAQPLGGTRGAIGHLSAGQGNRLFAVITPNGGAGVIVELNPTTGAEIRRFNAPEAAFSGQPVGLAFDGTTLYFVNGFGSRRLFELNPDTGAILDSTLLPALNQIDGLAALGGRVYASDAGGNQIVEFNPVTNAVVRTFTVAADLFGGLAGITGPNRLVATVNNSANGLTTVVEIDPATGGVAASFGTGIPFNAARGVAVVNGQILVSRVDVLRTDVYTRTGTLVTTLTTTSQQLSLGGDGVPPDDWFSIDLAAGAELRLGTATPAGGPGEFLNGLDPRIELYAANGTLVATGTALLDGRNESIVFTAPAAGTYRIRVTGQNNTTGEYVLNANLTPVAADDAAATDEDAAVTVAVLANDADDVLSTATVEVNTGPANGTVAVNADGTITYTPAANFSGVDTFTYVLRDGAGVASAPATVTVTVRAVADAPTVAVNPTAEGDENAPIPLTVSAALADADGSESLSLTVSGVPAGGTLSAGTDLGGGVWSLSAADLVGLTLTLPDNLPGDATFALTVTATSTEGANGSTASASASIAVTVRNVAPTAVLDAPAAADEGSPVTVSVTDVADVSPADAAAGFEYAFDFGNGFGTFTSASSATFTPANDGLYPVRVQVRDKDGGVREYAATVAVANVLPTVTAGPDQTVNEGDLVTFNGTFTDPGTEDPHTLTWSVTAPNGQVVATGGGAAFAFRPADDGTYTVTFTVTDDDGEVSDTAVVVVNNVAPTGSFVVPATSVEGSSVTVSVENVADPSPTDAAAGFEYAFDFGGGFGPFGPSSSAAFTPADDGAYPVRVQVRDKDGGVREYAATVNVANVLPTADAGPDRVVNEGDLVTLTGTFADPGTADPHTLTWRVTASNGQVVADGSGATFSFRPADNGTYVVTFTVTDDDGSSTDTVSVTADNVAPQDVAVTGPATGFRGQTLAYAGTFTDPGTADSHTLAWQVTLGGTLVAAGSGTAFAFVPAASGSYTVTLTVTDDDGGSRSATRVVTVAAVGVEADPALPGQYTLIVGGTNGNDDVRVKPDGQSGRVKVELNGVNLGTFSAPGGGPLGSVTVYALDGNDEVEVSGGVRVPTRLFGGAGDDVLKGGGGDDVLVGGTGDDELDGGTGRDILIGGTGADELKGQSDGDVLIGGYTIYDASVESLVALHQVWRDQTLSDQQRVAALRDATLRNGVYLGDATVANDTSADELSGGSGFNWFWFDIGRDDANAKKGDRLETNFD